MEKYNDNMKINYIANTRIPTEKAHGYQICKMCQAFSRIGFEVKLWTPRRKNKIEKNLYDFYDIKRDFIFEEIKSPDFIQYVRYLGRFAFYLQTLVFVVKLLCINIEKNEIIYTRNPEIVWLFNLRGFKTVYECHDWFGRSKKISLFLLKNANLIITTNSFIKSEFMKNGFEDSRLLIAPNGVELTNFDINMSKEEAISALNLPVELNNKIILLYTGSFKTMGVDKGINEILKAIKLLKNKNIFFFAVGGNNKDIVYYKRLAESLAVKERVFLLSRQNQKILAIYQKAADIFLMPYPRKAHYEYFMTPLKMFEYMAGKKPIIASDLPSIREILDDTNAVLVEPGNSAAFIEAIKSLLHNKELSAKISNKAFDDVQKYTWAQRAERIITFLKI